MFRLVAFLVGAHYLLSALSYIYTDASSSDLLIYFLDVGQGDSIVISSGTDNLIIDGGPSYGASDFVYNLSRFNDCSSTSVLLTHPHYDHLAGLNRMLAFCKPRTVYTTSVKYESKAFDQFQVLTAGLNRRYLQSGDKISVGEAQFYVLWPSLEQLESKSSNINNFSIVLLLDYGEFEAIFTGDAEAGALAKIDIQKYANLIDGELELYKMSHHGAANGLSKELLEYLKPEIAVISVGKNSYGHPSQEVLDFLEEMNVEILRTDLEGHIRIKAEKNNASM